MKKSKLKKEDGKQIDNKKSKTKSGKASLTYTISKKNCVGCGKCKKKCPAKAIKGKKKEVHKIRQEKCIKCGKCFSVCKHNAVCVDKKGTEK
ncbi:MAG TPA: 4Fe-4S dicluster domain-containing protein [Acetobacterium sp.]